jgi:hypothetical protein
MGHLRCGIALEAPTRLLEELGDHREIPLGGCDPAVSEVRREVRQEPLDVGTFTVPGDQSVHGK